MSIAHLREEYRREQLDERDVAADPLAQFHRWFQQAREAEVHEPNAMALASADATGSPSVRMVLLKEADECGFVFITDYRSRKGGELDRVDARAALCFWWGPLERQVRIEGRVEKVTDAEADAYYASRPLDSRIGAWASPQSQVISGRTVLVAQAARYAAQFALHPPRPPHWGGFRLVPDRWEFWQGRKSRLHDRLRYTQQPTGGWLRERLAP